MKKNYSKLLLMISLSATLILGCLSINNTVFATVDVTDEENIEIETIDEEDIEVEAVDEENMVADSAADPDTAETVIDTPSVKTPTNISTGIKVSWTKSTGADGYYIYRRVKGGTWEKITTVAGQNTLSYIDQTVVSGTTYEYTVSGYYNKGTETISGDYDQNGKSVHYIAAPTISKLACTNAGIEITWGKVNGAEKYRVYYKTGSGSWTGIASTTSNSYTWTKANPGITYTFTVRCISSDGSNTSSYDDTGKSIQYLETPQISAVTNVNGGIKITWNKPTGSTKYRLYYRTGSGSWTKLADTTSNSYTWTGAKSGTTYTFTVRCMSSDGKISLSGHDTKGKSLTYIAAPQISAVTNVDGGVQITWNKSAGAAKYRVYYKTVSGSWKKIADTTSTSYTWTGAKSGTTYTYTVRCISSDGKSYTSGYDSAGKSSQYIAAPKISSVKNVESGIKITWGKVTGAKKYRVYYKTGSGSWTKLTDTTSTSYTWAGAKRGTTYTFTVRGFTTDPKSYISGYDKKGQSIIRLAQPVISKISADNSGVNITWGKVAGATKYRVYYKSSSGWKLLKETTATSYTADMTVGKTYVYTVKAISGSNTSSYHSGTSFKRLPAPSITGVSKTDNGVKISWGKVDGAAKYRVYYKANSGSWTKIADTVSTSYTWKGAKEGTLYRFTVRCLNSDGTAFTSGADAQGRMLPNSEEQYYAAQVLDKVGWNLWAAFQWSAGMPYERFYTDPVPSGYTKCQWYSLYGFKNYRGNCHVMASTFYHMAILLGYDAHYVFGYVPRQRGGLGEHGWVEIDLDGTTYVCDPDFTLYTTTVQQGFMFKYKTPGTWVYQNYHREN